MVQDVRLRFLLTRRHRQTPKDWYSAGTSAGDGGGSEELFFVPFAVDGISCPFVPLRYNCTAKP